MHHVRSVLFLAAASLVWTPARGQVVDTAVGKVEFVGLETTTPEQALEPLIKEAKGGRPHLCAANFLKAGFADASVRMLSPGGPVSWVVKLVEPAHKDRIHRRATPVDQCTLPETWTKLRKEMDDPGIAFQVAMNWLGKVEADKSTGHSDTYKAAAVVFGKDVPFTSAELDQVWNLVRLLQTPADRDRALWIIHHDRDAGNRSAAACVLANFPDSDLAYWELADALLDEHGMVSDFAQKALKAMAAARPRTVDWAPALPTLRSLLDGTNLFAFDTIAQILHQTRVSPEHARQLLGNSGGAMLLASAQAAEPSTQTTARALLKHLRGQDLGVDWAAWQAWMKSL